MLLEFPAAWYGAIIASATHAIRFGAAVCDNPCSFRDERHSTISDAAETFNALVRPHLDRLYRLAWRLTGNQAGAEDLFQDLLTKAYTKLDQLVGIDEVGPWLARVQYNLFIDERRRYARERLIIVAEGEMPAGGIGALAGSDDPAENAVKHERLAALERALDKLSDEHHIVILLHDTEGYKLEEIHGLIGVPVGTIKSRLHRARARLREILDADGTFSA